MKHVVKKNEPITAAPWDEEYSAYLQERFGVSNNNPKKTLLDDTAKVLNLHIGEVLSVPMTNVRFKVRENYQTIVLQLNERTFTGTVGSNGSREYYFKDKLSGQKLRFDLM